MFSSATETCRDLGHVQLGYATLVNTAETAWQQGVDLYGEEQDRLIAGAQVLCSPLACDSERHCPVIEMSQLSLWCKLAHVVLCAGAELHASLLLAEPEPFRQPIPPDVCGGKVRGNEPLPPDTKPTGT